MRHQLVEMKRAHLESVTHEITGSEREGGKEGERGTEGEGEGEGESSICIFMLIKHSKCILTSVTS